MDRPTQGNGKIEDASPVETITIPLCIDLDGTLLWTDLLWESIFLLLKEKPYLVLRIPFWLLGGKASFKSELAHRTEIDASNLPYNQAFLEYVTEQYTSGRTLVLVTASPDKMARKVADHLGFFSEVYSTSNGVNLSGLKKRELLVSKFGENGFDYAGNSRDDLSVWSASKNAIVVNAHSAVQNSARKISSVERTFHRRKVSLKVLAKALRIHQWAKNLLVFLPLFAAHQEKNVILLGKSMLAFVAFSLCASAVYVMNDLLDLPSDRRHPRKRHRPFAAGLLPLPTGFVLFPMLLGLSFGAGFLLNSGFFLTLSTYFFLTMAYSLWIKRIVMLDIIFLAILYTLRIIAGGTAIEISPSFWILAFSIFFFLSLAMVKRYSELLVSKRAGQVTAYGRGYHTEDFPILHSLGAASGYGAVLVLALYINSPEIQALYRHPQLLWSTIPILLFWISRIWLISHRGLMHDDPVVFAIRDKVSLILGLLVALTIFGAT